MRHPRWLPGVVGVMLLGLAVWVALPARSQSQTPPPASPRVEAQGQLFAVEIKTGPSWDTTKPAHEQAYFREHSANLKRLRDNGSLVLGARYADKGLVIVQAESLAQARAMFESDPAMQHGVFAFELHDFNVFYSGAVQVRRRAAP